MKWYLSLLTAQAEMAPEENQAYKQRSNPYRTWTVRAYTGAESFDIIREKGMMTTLETRKQVFAGLPLLEIWPWPCWEEHNMGTFCSPSPPCCRQNVCHSFTDVTGITSKPYHRKKSEKRENEKGAQHSNQLFPETAAGYFLKMLSCFGVLLCTFCFWAVFGCR